MKKHKYDIIVECLRKVFLEIEKLGISDVMSKGGVGEILLAHYLEQELIGSDKGPDGIDKKNQKFEYKVSTTDQFNFHFGTRETKKGSLPQDKVMKHFDGIVGAYCAERVGASFVKLIYLPTTHLVSDLCDHFAKSHGKQLNKNYRFESLKKITGSILLM